MVVWLGLHKVIYIYYLISFNLNALNASLMEKALCVTHSTTLTLS